MNVPRIKGFTLIELLAALAIFALISGSLYAALGVSLRAFDSAGRRLDSAQQMRVVSELIQRGLEQNYPLALVGQGGWRLLFDGNAQAVQYVANLPGFLGFGGLYEVSLRAVRFEGRKRLVLDRRPIVVDKVRGDLRGAMQSQVLMEDLQSLKWRYYGADARSEESPGWQNEWHDRRRLPALVEARIVAVDGAVWPPIVARIWVNEIRFQMAPGSGPTGNTSTGASVTTRVLN